MDHLSLETKKKISQLTEGERSLITNKLNISDDAQIDEYSSVLLNSTVFFETTNYANKRTIDTFMLNTNSRKFSEINSIFVFQEKLYFLINEKNADLCDPGNKCHFIRFLSLAGSINQKVIESKYVDPKYALVKFDNTITCSKFPNMYERN